jgi:hypothetical protein
MKFSLVTSSNLEKVIRRLACCFFSFEILFSLVFANIFFKVSKEFQKKCLECNSKQCQPPNTIPIDNPVWENVLKPLFEIWFEKLVLHWNPQGKAQRKIEKFYSLFQCNGLQFNMRCNFYPLFSKCSFYYICIHV